jgi:hypothetical protein
MESARILGFGTLTVSGSSVSAGFQRLARLARISQLSGITALSSIEGALKFSFEGSMSGEQRNLTRAEIAVQRERLDRLTREIGERRATIGRDIWEIGIRLDEVRRGELWRAGRYASYDDYLRRAAKLSRRTASRFIRIAAHFSREIARTYGVEKLEAILRWEDATPAAELPGDLAAAQIRLRDERGRFYRKALHDAQSSEILDAVALLEEAKRGAHGIPASVKKKAARLSAALPPPPAGVRSAGRVRVTRAKDGALSVSFTAIPLAELDAFLRAVEEHLVDE